MPLHLGFSAWAMPQMPGPDQIALVRGAGYAGIELVSSPTASLAAERMSAEECRHIRSLLDAASADVPFLPSPAR